MKWCRFQAGSSASYGLVEDETVIEVAGSPFEEYTVTGPNFRTPTAIEPPRSVQLGVQLTF